MASHRGNAAADDLNPRKHRKDKRCSLAVNVGRTKIEGICDTGASGGNCLDYSVFMALPVESYTVISRQTSVCVGIDKTPVRIVGKVLLNFSLRSDSNHHQIPFREEFNIIENLIHHIGSKLIYI